MSKLQVLLSINIYNCTISELQCFVNAVINIANIEGSKNGMFAYSQWKNFDYNNNSAHCCGCTYMAYGNLSMAMF